MQFLYLGTLVLDSGQQCIQLFIIYIHRIERIDTFDKVTKNIHIIGKSIKRRFINATVQTDTALLGSHETEVVTCLQIIPVLLDTAVITEMDTFGNTIQLVECFTLHHITQPTAGISFFVHPRHRVWNIQLGNRFQFGNDFRRCGESNPLFLGTVWKSLQEFQNIGRQRLCHTQSREFHKDIDDLLFLRQSVNPVDVLVGKQRILVPLGVGEAQADVVRQLKITQQ